MVTRSCEVDGLVVVLSLVSLVLIAEAIGDLLTISQSFQKSRCG
jgi:hypothetical protein